MKYFIKMWPDNTATLVTNHGKTLLTFESLEKAQHTLRRLTIKPTPDNVDLPPIVQHPAYSAS